MPWNFPFVRIARKMAPPPMTGNTIVIKSSEETPLNAFDFIELRAEAGLPKGVFNLVAVVAATLNSAATHRRSC